MKVMTESPLFTVRNPHFTTLMNVNGCACTPRVWQDKCRRNEAFFSVCYCEGERGTEIIRRYSRIHDEKECVCLCIPTFVRINFGTDDSLFQQCLFSGLPFPTRLG